MPTKSKQIWVSPDGDDGWKVHRPGNERASARTDTKAEAKSIAESIARNQGLETKIQRQDGTIQGWNSYGNDPCPPKDKD